MNDLEWAAILIGLSLLAAFYIWEGRECPDALDEETDMIPWHIEQREALDASYAEAPRRHQEEKDA